MKKVNLTLVIPIPKDPIDADLCSDRIRSALFQPTWIELYCDEVRDGHAALTMLGRRPVGPDPVDLLDRLDRWWEHKCRQGPRVDPDAWRQLLPGPEVLDRILKEGPIVSRPPAPCWSPRRCCCGGSAGHARWPPSEPGRLEPDGADLVRLRAFLGIAAPRLTVE